MGLIRLVAIGAMLLLGWWVWRGFRAQRKLERLADYGAVPAEVAKSNRTKLIALGIALLIVILVVGRLTGLFLIPF